MHMAGGGDAEGGRRGDARASCASPLGTPLVRGIVERSMVSDRYLDPDGSLNLSCWIQEGKNEPKNRKKYRIL
jgi:hypothetical protein